MTKISMLLFAVVLSFASFLQGKNEPCTALEASQFDFWLGEWDLTWGNNLKGTNSITKEMGTCVIHEHFNDPVKKYIGESWSMFNPQTKLWQQTWVDNAGEYIALTGEFRDGVMELRSQTINPSGKVVKQRMRFTNITSSSFDWAWESSKDEGKTWNPDWRIHYQRKKS